jgi:hypothetical protein
MGALIKESIQRSPFLVRQKGISNLTEVLLPQSASIIEAPQGGGSSTAGRKNNNSKQEDLGDDSDQKLKIENIRYFFPE